METNGWLRTLTAEVESDEPCALLRQPRLVLAWDEGCEGWVLQVSEPRFDLDLDRARGLLRA